MSNVPGADIEVYFAGSTIVAQYPIGPLGGAAVNVTLLSYLGTAYIGLNLDRAAITEIDLFVDCIQQGLEAVVQAGRTNRLANGRGRGIEHRRRSCRRRRPGRVLPRPSRSRRRVARSSSSTRPRFPATSSAATASPPVRCAISNRSASIQWTCRRGTASTTSSCAARMGREVEFPLPRGQGQFAVVARRVDLDFALVEPRTSRGCHRARRARVSIDHCARRSRRSDRRGPRPLRARFVNRCRRHVVAAAQGTRRRARRTTSASGMPFASTSPT